MRSNRRERSSEGIEEEDDLHSEMMLLPADRSQSQTR